MYPDPLDHAPAKRYLFTQVEEDNRSGMELHWPTTTAGLVFVLAAYTDGELTARFMNDDESYLTDDDPADCT